MFNIEVKGYLFKKSAPIYTILTGYIVNIYGLRNPKVTHLLPTINASIYLSADHYLCFELSPKGEDWHASDISIERVIGGSAYNQRSMLMKVNSVKLGARY